MDEMNSRLALQMLTQAFHSIYPSFHKMLALDDSSRLVMGDLNPN